MAGVSVTEALPVKAVFWFLNNATYLKKTSITEVLDPISSNTFQFKEKS